MARRAAEIILGDETLRTVYLLRNAARTDAAPISDDKAARFLLWFAVEGRHACRNVVISPDYLAFLDAPVPPCRSRLAAYLLISRPDLRARFGSNVEAFEAWYRDGGAQEHGLGAFIRPASDEALPGVNIIGFGDTVMGIGEDARALAAVLGHAGIARSIVSLSLPADIGTTGRHGLDGLHADQPVFPVNIFAIPAIETARLHVERGSDLFRRRYSIGYWPWELTTLPPCWHGVFDLVDEVWASSEFLFDVYSRLTDKPVILMPPFLNIPEPEPFDLAALGLPGGATVFLVMFDFNSFVSRKNPEGAIAAFRMAFPDPGGPERLIVKTLNAHAHPDADRALRARIGGDPRIVLIDRALGRGQVAGLIAAADCLVSLHRSEGFGRVLAEAMALGTAVVATDWSGSTSFLDATRSYPVGFTLRDVSPGEYILSEGSQWAEPSIEDAARHLRAMRDNRASDGGMRARARDFVRGAYGLDAVTAAVAGRLGAIAALSGKP